MLVLVLMLIGFVAGVLTFWETLTTFLVAALIAYLLSPLTDFIVKKTGTRRGIAVAIVLLLFVSALVLLVSLAVPPLIEQVAGLIDELQTYAENFDDVVYSVTSYLTRLHVPQEVIDGVSELVAQSDTYILSFALSLLGELLGLSLQIFDLIVAIILIVYFMLDGRKLLQDFVNFLPDGMRPKVQHLMTRANGIAKRYIKARIIVCCFMASAVFIGLNVLGVKYAGIFAVISFFLDFIPYFGSLIACVIEIFYALITGGLSKAIAVAVFVIAVQQIEGNILSPKIEGNATDIHPITVLFALLASEKVFGPLGMLISTPVAAILKQVFLELFAYVTSDDDEDGPDPAPVLTQASEGE